MKTSTFQFPEIEQDIAKGFYDSAEEKIQFALQNHAESNVTLAQLFLLKGKTLSKSRNVEAHQFYDKAAQLCTDQNDSICKTLLAEVFFNKARDFQLEGDLKLALTFYNKSLTLIEIDHNFKLYYHLNNNIAILYRNLGIENYALNKLIETRDSFKSLSQDKIAETQDEYHRILFNIAMHYIYHNGDLSFALEYLSIVFDYYYRNNSLFEIITIGNETIETYCKLNLLPEAESLYQKLLKYLNNNDKNNSYIEFCLLLSAFTIAISKKEFANQKVILDKLRQQLVHCNKRRDFFIGYIPNLLLHFTNLYLETKDVNEIDNTFKEEIAFYLELIKTESNFLSYNTLTLIYNFYILTQLDGKETFYTFYIDYIQKTNALRNDVLLHDIKVKYQTNAIIEKLNIEKEVNIKLKELNSSLTNFAAIAAHDLKAPLRTITDFSKILSKRYADSIAPEDKIMFDYIIKGASSLNELISNLLEFSNLQHNKKQNAIVSLEDVIVEAKHILLSSINDAAAIIQYNTLPKVKGQETFLSQLFLNLINNSIKFRKKEEQLIIQIESKEIGALFYEIAFIDNGIGIDKQNHMAVFEPFKKLHSPQEFEGSGIGLATCKKIIEFHGGIIRIESELGKGTKMIFTLPKAAE